jgi:hypothetical protein
MKPSRWRTESRSVAITSIGGVVAAGTQQGDIRRGNSKGEELATIKVRESAASKVAPGLNWKGPAQNNSETN